MLETNAKLRAMVMPHGPEQASCKSELTATEPGCAHGRPARISWAWLLILGLQARAPPRVPVRGDFEQVA